MLMKWISVKERLPEDKKSWYLAITNFNEFFIVKRYFWEARNIWVFESNEGKTLTNISHWMPLPARPELSKDSE